MPPLVEVVVPPSLGGQHNADVTGLDSTLAKDSNSYHDQQLPITPLQNYFSKARITDRRVDEVGVHYQVKIGEVDFDDISVEEILDFVSALELEEFENREFERERDVFRIIEAEAALERERKLERRKERAKRKGTMIWQSDEGDQSNGDEEGSSRRHRKRPDYTQFYLKGDQRAKVVEEASETDEEPMLISNHPGLHRHPLPAQVKRRRRKRDPVTGELMQLSPEADTMSNIPHESASNLDHRKKSRRKRHPITGQLMPLGYRYDPDNPDKLRWVGTNEPSLKTLSLDEGPDAKRVRIGRDGSFSPAITQTAPKIETTSSASPKPPPSRVEAEVSAPSKVAVINLLSSDEDEDVTDQPAIQTFLKPPPKSPVTNRSSNLMLQSAPSPRGKVPLSAPPKQSARAISPGKTSLMNPSAASVLPAQGSQQQLHGDGDEDDDEWYVDSIIGHTWSDPASHPPEFGKQSIILYQVKWNGYENPTWEPAESFDDKSVLDEYRESAGLQKVIPIPQHTPESAATVANTNSKSIDARSSGKTNPTVKDESADEVEYEVERILAHHMSDPRSHPGKPTIMLYKVKWKGYEESTWEPARSFADQSILRKYQERHGLRRE